MSGAASGAPPPPARPAGGAASERWRRTLHVAAGGLGPLAAAAGPEKARLGFAALVAAAAIAEAARLAWPRAGALVARLAGPLFRPAERGGLSGATTLALGFAAAWWLFPGVVAERAILVEALSDPAAAAAGAHAGIVGRKSWQGSAACAVAAAAVLLLTGTPPLAAGAGAVAAALAERVPGRALDNLVVPLVVAAVLRLLA